MAYILVRHKVQDYDSWKPGFDDHASAREASGSKGGFVFRNAYNPSEVLVLLEWDHLDNARKFAQSDDLKEKTEEVGVVDQPDAYLLDEADMPSERLRVTEEKTNLSRRAFPHLYDSLSADISKFYVLQRNIKLY